MKMYLVRKYVDQCPDDAYGVCDKYYAIGLFADEIMANSVKEKATEAAAHSDYENEYDCYRTVIDIIPIEVDKIYDGENEIFLGGGCYIE